MEIIARFSHEKIDHSKDNTPQLVVSLKAPTLDWVTKRPTLCVLPLIDLSGSMAGSKLDYAKKSLLKLVEQLTADDVVGLVGFETRVHVFAKPERATPEFKSTLKGIINKLRTMGGTNLSDGILESLRVVEGMDLGPQYIKRVIMFTDGEPTSGITDKEQIRRLLRENRGAVSVSSFGYGGGSSMYGSCDQEFLTELAQEGSGNYAYVKDPDDALTAFARELGGLLSTYAQDLRVVIEPANGHQVEKVVTDVAISQNALGETEFKIPDILSEEIRNFVFDTKLLKQNKAFPRQATIFNVKLTYSVLTAEGKREGRTGETKARLQFVEPGEEQKEVTPELNEIIGVAQVALAQRDAEEAAKKGEFKTASLIMEDMAGMALARGLHNTARVASKVAERVGSQAMYAQSAGYLRSMSVGSTRTYGLAGMDDEAAEDLVSFGMVLENSAMEQAVQSFTTDDEPTPAGAGISIDPAAGVTVGSGGAIHIGGLTSLAAGSAIVTGDASPWVMPLMAGMSTIAGVDWGLAAEAVSEDDTDKSG